MKTLNKLVEQTGSLTAALFAAEEMIEDLKSRLKLLTISYQKIDQYKKEIYDLNIIRINIKHKLNENANK